MGREFELKYKADAAALEAIRSCYGPFQTITMATTYYDTPDRRLSPLHWTLRQRFENETSVCTLKTPCADGGRGEWETECDDIHAAIPELCKLGAPEELTALVSGGVEPVCAARFTRLAARIRENGCLLELALDQGVLRGGGREMPLCEVEVELKSGEDADAILFAKLLAARFGLVPEHHSKYRRALTLAQNK